ncbi:MAG: hypothetical protein PHP85_06255 [Gallionella sp.]|nr:hypothetical protein [Gallionella sp.]
MKNAKNFTRTLLAVSLLCGTVTAIAATASVENPLLGKNSSAVTLSDSTMEKVTGSGTLANSYGAVATANFYNAYYYAYYSRYVYAAGSSSERYGYMLAGWYGGFGNAYASAASFYSSYNY